jgi:hypothetical protein
MKLLIYPLLLLDVLENVFLFLVLFVVIKFFHLLLELHSVLSFGLLSRIKLLLCDFFKVICGTHMYSLVTSWGIISVHC